MNCLKNGRRSKEKSKNIVDAIQNVFNSKLLKKVNKIKDRGNYMEQKAEFHYFYGEEADMHSLISLIHEKMPQVKVHEKERKNN